MQLLKTRVLRLEHPTIEDLGVTFKWYSDAGAVDVTTDGVFDGAGMATIRGRENVARLIAFAIKVSEEMED